MQGQNGRSLKKWIGSRNCPKIWGEGRWGRNRAAKEETRATAKRSRRYAVTLPLASCSLISSPFRWFFWIVPSSLRSLGRPAWIRVGARLPPGEILDVLLICGRYPGQKSRLMVSSTLTNRWENCFGCRHRIRWGARRNLSASTRSSYDI